MEYLLWARPCVGASDKIRQRTQSSVERTGMQINSSIKYCGSLTDVLSRCSGGLQFCWEIRKEFPEKIAVVVGLK